MTFFKKNYTFNIKEIFAMFLLLLLSGVLIFTLGIMIGKRILENDCQAILENGQKKLDQCENELKQKAVALKLPKKTEETKVTENIEKKENYSHLAIKEITNDIKGKYTVQISSHKTEIEAQQRAYKFYDLGFKSAYYMESEIPHKGIWYRVGIGFFPKYSSAKIFADMLKRQGKIVSYVVRKVK